jgi:hypothetical protein
MNQDEIIEMARNAGFSIADGIVTGGFTDVKRFAKLVAEREREACAIECEKIALALTEWPNSSEGLTAETKLMRSLGEFVHKPFTEAIRARGQA